MSAAEEYNKEDLLVIPIGKLRELIEDSKNLSSEEINDKYKTYIKKLQGESQESLVEKYETALQQIATGEIVGETRVSYRDTLYICRDIARTTLAGVYREQQLVKKNRAVITPSAETFKSFCDRDNNRELKYFHIAQAVDLRGRQFHSLTLCHDSFLMDDRDEILNIVQSSKTFGQ